MAYDLIHTDAYALRKTTEIKAARIVAQTHRILVRLSVSTPPSSCGFVDVIERDSGLYKRTSKFANLLRNTACITDALNLLRIKEFREGNIIVHYSDLPNHFFVFSSNHIVRNHHSSRIRVRCGNHSLRDQTSFGSTKGTRKNSQSLCDQRRSSLQNTTHTSQ